jgi:hypothetical protein
MDLSAGVDELQRVADYRKARNLLRAFGGGSLIFGVLNTGIGVMALDEHPLNFVLVLIGGFQILVGLLNVAAPTSAGIIADGLAFLVVGGWNLFITVVNIQEGAPETGHFLIYGALQIGIGIYRFATFGQFSKELAHKPPAEDIKRLDVLVKDLQKANLKKSPDVITFKTSNFLGGWVEWRGRLAGASALLAHQRGHEALIAHKDDVTITKTGKVLIGKTLKAKFQVRDKKLNGLISPESFAKYEEWKEGDGQSDRDYDEDDLV